MSMLKCLSSCAGDKLSHYSNHVPISSTINRKNLQNRKTILETGELFSEVFIIMLVAKRSSLCSLPRMHVQSEHFYDEVLPSLQLHKCVRKRGISCVFLKVRGVFCVRRFKGYFWRWCVLV